MSAIGQLAAFVLGHDETEELGLPSTRTGITKVGRQSWRKAGVRASQILGDCREANAGQCTAIPLPRLGKVGWDPEHKGTLGREGSPAYQPWRAPKHQYHQRIILAPVDSVCIDTDCESRICRAVHVQARNDVLGSLSHDIPGHLYGTKCIPGHLLCAVASAG
jgi:hypothetical protein